MGQGATLLQALDRNNQSTPSCPYMGPRQHIANWKLLMSDPVLLQGIAKGVKAPMHSVPGPKPPRQYKVNAIANGKKVNAIANWTEATAAAVQQYLDKGVLQPLSEDVQSRVRYWVPVFPRPKGNSGKVRLITDLRDLNNCHNAPHHKQETWRTLLQTLQDRRLQWASPWTSRTSSTTWRYTPASDAG